MKSRWLKFFLPADHFWRPPAQFNQDYDIRTATPDELILMRHGYARNPVEAGILIRRYGTVSAAEMHHRRHHRTAWQKISSGIVRIVMKVEGARPASRIQRRHEQPLQPRYRIKR
jgi:hypothetical protein